MTASTAAPRRFAADRGLTARMLVVIFLLGLVYVAAVAAMVAFRVQPAVIGVVIVAFFLFQWFGSDKIALYAMRAQVVEPEDGPLAAQLHAVIDRLCALSDTPKPRLAIADSDVPNAFAAGRSPKKAVMCATTGILRRLDAEELEGVLAHELSHVAHRDVAVMTVASFLGVLAGLITRFAFYAEMFGGGGRGRGRNNQDSGALMILAVMVVSALVYALSFLLIRALSRYRELSADRSGALLTGRPSALASALVKVTGEMGRIPTRDLRSAEPFNAFFFAPALAGGASMATLLSTHPSLEQRLDQLGRIARDLGQAI